MYRHLILILFVTLSLNLLAQNWSIQLVEYGGAPFQDTSIDVDSIGHPHIAYCFGYATKYAKWNGTSWQIQLLDSIGITRATKLCLDQHGNPHIGYLKYLYNHPAGQTCFQILYTFWNGISWHTELVDSFYVSAQSGPYLYERSLDFTLSHNGIPYLTYPFINLNDSIWEVRCTYRDTDSWRITSISQQPLSRPTYQPRIALDSTGHPHIIFDDRYRSKLYYAYFDADTWTITQVDSSLIIIIPYSIEIDESNKIHIAYQSGLDAFYAVLQDTVWHIELAGSNGLSLAFGDFVFHNGPHIVNSATFASPAYFYKDIIWHEELIDNDGGFYLSIAVDRFGGKHVSYGGSGLLYARRIVSGVEEHEITTLSADNNFEVYPNPAKGFFTIRLPQTADRSQIKIFDVAGKMVREVRVKTQEARVSLERIKNGVYFVQVGDKSEIKKLVIIK